MAAACTVQTPHPAALFVQVRLPRRSASKALGTRDKLMVWDLCIASALSDHRHLRSTGSLLQLKLETTRPAVPSKVSVPQSPPKMVCSCLHCSVPLQAALKRHVLQEATLPARGSFHIQLENQSGDQMATQLPAQVC